MEEEGCCCPGQAGHRPDTFTRLLRQKETRLRRMAQVLAVLLLLLISAVLAVLLTVVLGGRSEQSHNEQAAMQPDSNPVSAGQQQQEDLKRNPSAMLTAPKGNIIAGDYLEWESDSGNAFCLGGFNYSSGNLVVPRSGVYRVFLQITYESTEDLECLDDELKLTNRVVSIRDTYDVDVPLLSSVDTVSCSMEQWSKCLYTAGLFHLDANCRLRVTSSNPELIAKKEYQVFFGAELLPQ